MSTKKQLKVTLVRSPIAALPRHKATVRGLGLRRMHSSVVIENTACTRGMVQKIIHLLSVEEV